MLAKLYSAIKSLYLLMNTSEYLSWEKKRVTIDSPSEKEHQGFQKIEKAQEKNSNVHSKYVTHKHFQITSENTTF